MANLSDKILKSEQYYPLDNSANFTASVASKAAPYIYRISCDLDHPIYLPDLEKALSMTIERFPYFKTELRSGIFWYYLDPLKEDYQLLPDSLYPVEYQRPGKWGRYLFRVKVYGARIACEFHHILTDGTGALEFLRTLTAVYLSLRGVVCENWLDIIRPGTPVNPAEFKDAYAGLLNKKIPLPPTLPPAFHIPGKRYNDDQYRFTHGKASVQQALEISRKNNVSLTELLSAIYLYSLQTIAESGLNPDKFPICNLVPVNLRKLYHEKTLRNFFLFVPLTLDRRLGHYEFDEVITQVYHQSRLLLNTKELNRQIRRNVGGEYKLISRIFPLTFKHPILRMISRRVADNPFSGSLSNLGRVIMPDEFAAHITRFDFIPPRNDQGGASIGVISYKDRLSLTVGSRLVERELEKNFFPFV